jgi:hypothetical protein
LYPPSEREGRQEYVVRQFDRGMSEQRQTPGTRPGANRLADLGSRVRHAAMAATMWHLSMVSGDERESRTVLETPSTAGGD